MQRSAEMIAALLFCCSLDTGHAPRTVTCQLLGCRIQCNARVLCVAAVQQYQMCVSAALCFRLKAVPGLAAGLELEGVQGAVLTTKLPAVQLPVWRSYNWAQSCSSKLYIQQ